MHILLSNDDGVHAPGIAILHKALSSIATVTTVAPDRNCSGASNSLTLENPLRTKVLENGFISVTGTPTDCVHLAINELLETPPDLVVSGINAGANLGDDVLYSGTVAAATEGRTMGLPAIAISTDAHQPEHFETAAQVAVTVVKQLIENPLTSGQVININVPDIPLNELKGIRVARCGARHRAESMIRGKDPRGDDIFWLGPPGEKADAGEGTDFHTVAEGYASVTPLKIDLTAHEMLPSMAQWLDGVIPEGMD